MTPLKARPTQKELDELFVGSNRARVIYPVAKTGAPTPSIIVITEDRLGQLRAALPLHPDEVPMGCHCPGTVSVELLKGNARVATLHLHLHRQAHSLWLSGSSTGAALRDGQTVLDLLAQWGMPQPLQLVLESSRERTNRGNVVGLGPREKKAPRGKKE